MQTNLSTWHYYSPGFLDPLYVPYQKKYVKTPFSDGCGKQNDGNTGIVSENGVPGGEGECPINTWEQQGYADGLVHPELVRKGWGKSFQLQTAYDPCPYGYSKGQDGWCYPVYPEYEPIFYTKKAFIAKNQYFDGSYPKHESELPGHYSNFDMKSVHPNTGRYMIYHRSVPAPQRKDYGGLRVGDSYLA